MPDLRALGVAVETLSCQHPWNFVVRRKLRRQLEDFDIVLAHGNRAGELTVGKGFPPVIAVAHSRFFERLPHFAAVVALSEPRARELNTAHVIPNFVRLPARTERGFRSPPVIGALGRFSHEKGFDLFLDALSLLRERGQAFRAVIGGSGPLERDLKAQAQTLGLDGLLTWAGWIDDKNSFYRSIDIFCLPSRTESFSISLLEAMSEALPAVATDCGGPASIVIPQVTGIITAIDAASIAAALAKIFADPARALGMGAAARTRVEETYALSVVAKKLSTLLAETLDAARR
jgi:glycosyltransferase involved in cell wall biosynthesis